jgi:hypothetical protein
MTQPEKIADLLETVTLRCFASMIHPAAPVLPTPEDMLDTSKEDAEAAEDARFADELHQAEQDQAE